MRRALVGRAGPGKEGGKGRWDPYPCAGLRSCFLSGLSCPKKKTRNKRNVNFQKAIHEKCELWAPVQLSTWPKG